MGHELCGFQIWTDLAPAVQQQPNLMFAKCVVQAGSTPEMLQVQQVEPADPLVVAINPFKDLGNTTKEWICKYRDTDDYTKLPPHVFYTARVALDNLHGVNKSQTIIVSGESGAGKTEATKQIMRYFAAAKGGAMDMRIQNAIMAANPVLEAFGNAKTIRNNNSSRFGRFMQLDVAKEGGIRYGSVVAFLLEKSRVLTQDEQERSYHIFYQLCKGADASMRERFHLLSLDQYTYINPKCFDVPGIDDLADYKEVCDAFKSMALTDEQVDSVWSVVAGVLLLGNVQITATKQGGMDDAAAIEGANLQLFKEACGLLFIDPDEVMRELTTKVTYAGGQRVESRWRQEDGDMLKSSLAKAMYDKLFLWIISELNKSIKPPEGFKNFLGMLDIFGFEVFKNNSLEQFFINVTNEMLQKNFVDIVFTREAKLYKEENVSTAELVYTSNADVINRYVINLLTDKKSSILSSLEDQCLAPGGSDEKFVAACKSAFKNSTKFKPAKVSPNINFLVSHTIGDIQYSAEGFLFKNKDVLRAEIMEIVQASTNVVVKDLFAGIVMEKGKIAKGQLIGSQFLKQLEALMELINSTEPHFVRCVKPNDTKKPLDWVQSKVLIQLHALSVLEALQLRQVGFSYRRPFKDFLYQFKFIDLGITESSTLAPRAACEALLEKAKVDKKQFQVGKSMIFLKQEAAKQLTLLQRQCLSAWSPLVAVLEAVYFRLRLRQLLAKKQRYLVRAQAHIRRHIVDHNVSPPAITRLF
ncbi:LOW QUALITY PROTEIN: uncharacterized protein EMH_0067060 [Eimeria mitis]|uniref:Myosin motor domain-containing protein n=1 Tax=Eimeria mitis TaxID=44415 RepID=U6K7L5_9EIME|nr:LOW QUALITY PROTEIN: uncharacterized protein EMH_0067060 [Eimeria mitis]CDJ31473.1 hypothetical protein EMH_0067060 [Eimeria mitis]